MFLSRCHRIICERPVQVISYLRNHISMRYLRTIRSRGCARKPPYDSNLRLGYRISSTIAVPPILITCQISVPRPVKIFITFQERELVFLSKNIDKLMKGQQGKGEAMAAQRQRSIYSVLGVGSLDRMCKEHICKIPWFYSERDLEKRVLFLFVFILVILGTN